ncbi:MAG: quinoprotein dehydrogenase-associated SoxYZ-like carrier [Pseudomonadota bacterium]
MLTRFMSATVLAAALGLTPALAEEIRNPLKDGETWADLRGDVIGDVQIQNGAGLFALDAPYRAHDAAIVPIRITQDAGSDTRITRLTLVVDENPAPVVATFDLDPGIGHLDLETRVRVDQYSNVRAIAETEEGQTYMAGRYVKGAGGCSAPALKDMEASLAAAGKMRMKFFDQAVGAAKVGTVAKASAPAAQSSMRQQAQVMIRHPNYSGMQRNQVTNLFIPAFFIHELEVFQGEERLFRMEGGISISEDPVFRFTYTPNGAETFRVRATDTDGTVYERSFPAAGQAS